MIALGCDHGGFELMQLVKSFFDSKGIEYFDCGTFSKESCDYPDFAGLVCNAVVSGNCDRGILICGTGIGMSIAANKHVGIRAGLCHSIFTGEMCRAHNDANVLCLGARVLEPELALKIVEVFLDTEFEGGRHSGRVGKLNELDGLVSLH
jgi:ribose 5-phosphate isomerase B